MIIHHVKVYTPEKTFVPGSIVIKEDRIETVYARGQIPRLSGEDVLDGKGAFAIPGLIDLHFHGCMGDDFCDGTIEGIERIARYEASIGVTAISPATMTLPLVKLEQILQTAAKYRRFHISKEHADLVGINMEGPFISPSKKGAQDAKHILPCSVSACRRCLRASEGLVKLIGIAPEENRNFTDFIREISSEVNVSLAHTNADYDTAMNAFASGASHAVHCYNAMPPFLHRSPGVIGAVSDSPHVTAELICDGIHLHPAVVRATFRMLGADRIILISDSMRATGMPDGTYTLGGLDVHVQGKTATLASNGALAGSATNLTDCLRIAVKEMQIPLEDAVACATANPAKRLGIFSDYGSIEPGKKAHIVLLDSDLDLQSVIKDGSLLI